jgi:hypothetical protein
MEYRKMQKNMMEVIQMLPMDVKFPITILGFKNDGGLMMAAR